MDGTEEIIAGLEFMFFWLLRLGDCFLGLGGS